MLARLVTWLCHTTLRRYRLKRGSNQWRAARQGRYLHGYDLHTPALALPSCALLRRVQTTAVSGYTISHVVSKGVARTARFWTWHTSDLGLTMFLSTAVDFKGAAGCIGEFVGVYARRSDMCE